jgi:hypothetical protein
MKERYKPTAWADMPMGVRKGLLRWKRAFPSYDVAKTRGWECFQALCDRTHVYATNRSGHWYVTEIGHNGQPLR